MDLAPIFGLMADFLKATTLTIKEHGAHFFGPLGNQKSKERSTSVNM
jgi:hypothetical protein